MIQTVSPIDHRDQTVKYYYDNAGNITCEKKSKNNGWQEVQHVYDVQNRLLDTYQYLSETDWIRTSYQYDVMGNVTQMRTGDTPAEAGNRVTRYTYDRFGNVVSTTDARGYTDYKQYDKVGRLQEKTDRDGNQTVYQHDALERVTKETVQGQTVDSVVISEREFTYGSNSKLIREVSRELEDGKQTVFVETRYYYNDKGQLSRQVDPGNTVKVYTYNSCGNRQSFQLTTDGKAAPDIDLYYLYDERNMLKQVRKDGAAGDILAEYDYDQRGNRTILRYPQTGMETSYQYNDGNRVVSLKNKKQGTMIAAWDYDYDIDGNMISKTDLVSSPTVKITYQYDRLGRLTEEHNPGWKRTLYTYDAYSNRESMMVEGKTKEELLSVTRYEYSRNNWLNKEERKQGKVTETYQYRYDANGNETFRIWEKTAPTPDYPGTVELSGVRKKRFPTLYEWRHYNGFNQLIRVNQDEKEIRYQYRGDGLRHSRYVRELTEREGKTNVFCWDGSNIVAEQTDGEGVKCYLWGSDCQRNKWYGILLYTQ